MRKLILSKTTLCGDGSIEIQWMKQVLDPETGEVLFSEPHRTAVDLEGDIDTQMAAVSADMIRRGYGDVPSSHIARLKKLDAIGRADSEIVSTRVAAIASRRARVEEEAGTALARPTPQKARP